MNEWWRRWKLLFSNKTKSYGGELLRRCIAWRFKKLSREVCIEECGPYTATLLNWTVIFEWYIARLVLKNGQQDWVMRLDYYPQNVLKFNVSRFNSEHNLEGLYYHLRKKTIFTLTSHNIFDDSLIHAVSVSIHVLEYVIDSHLSWTKKNMDVCFSLCSCG